jgi:hypothetical protein
MRAKSVVARAGRYVEVHPKSDGRYDTSPLKVEEVWVEDTALSRKASALRAANACSHRRRLPPDANTHGTRISPAAMRFRRR